jgi:hypothetical protein
MKVAKQAQPLRMHLLSLLSEKILSQMIVIEALELLWVSKDSQLRRRRGRALRFCTLQLVDENGPIKTGCGLVAVIVCSFGLTSSEHDTDKG